MSIDGLVSVIIPTYGRAEKLNEAINSVIEQTYNNIEIIVVNDNNKDTPSFSDTESSISQYAGNKKIKFISDGVNVGGSQARNKGVYASNGEYITFLDDDDVFYENKIELQLQHLKESNADVSVCDMDMYLDGIKVKNKKSKASIGTLGEFVVSGNAFTPMILVKRDVIFDVGAFTTTPRFQDHVLMVKILGAGYQVRILDKPLFIHNIHSGDGITSIDNFEKGYAIRTEIESKYVINLPKTQRIKYYFMHNLTMARLERNKGNLLSVISYLFKSCIYLRSFSDLIKLSKKVISIIIYKKSRG